MRKQPPQFCQLNNECHMPLEIEIKLRAPSLDAIRQSLKDRGAKYIGLFHETNIFFDRPDRSLRAADTGLRIRIAYKQGNPATTLLTFKAAKQDSQLRSREAYDVYLEPGDQAIPLLNGLGFVRTSSFEKRRESWEFGDCKIELDELPIFGTFVEIEGPSEEIVLKVQNDLALQHLEIEKKSYAAMVGQHVAANTVKDNAITFA
jgi:predicted adenylyl cyclase CyaB